MTPSDIFLGIIAAIAVGTALFSFVCVFLVTRRPKSIADHTPPVTILKPLKGLDEALEENLRSFFQLDYPTFQLLFGVADPQDPAIAVVQRLIAEFPAQDARLIIGAPAFGLNPKVENLAAMDHHRSHDVLLISDSNVRVRPNYLRETVCYLAEPSVGLVSNLFVGCEESRFGATLENLQLNGYIAGGVAAASVVGVTCVVGKSMLMTGRVLEAIGGFASVRNLLAEDQVIGLKVRKAGYSIRLSHHVIENVNRDRDLRWFVNRHSRWYKIRLQLALPAYMIEPAGNLATVGLVWALSGDTGIAWGGLCVLWGLGIARDAIQTKRLRGTYPALKHMPLSIVKDLFLLPVWLNALFNRWVVWRGTQFHIGRYTRLRRDRVSRQARRRVRRIHRLRTLQAARPHL
jgi:ceramide glucosyltransferase